MTQEEHQTNRQRVVRGSVLRHLGCSNPRKSDMNSARPHFTGTACYRRPAADKHIDNKRAPHTPSIQLTVCSLRTCTRACVRTQHKPLFKASTSSLGYIHRRIFVFKKKAVFLFFRWASQTCMAESSRLCCFARVSSRVKPEFFCLHSICSPIARVSSPHGVGSSFPLPSSPLSLHFPSAPFFMSTPPRVPAK